MKKSNFSYLAIWIGIPVAIAVAIAIVTFVFFMEVFSFISVIGIFAVIGIIVAIPMILESKMKKAATALEADFPTKGFSYNYKFTTNNAIYYIDQGGRMGVIYRGNPTELQFVDLNKVTNVRVNDGKFGFGTSQVSCEFLLDGKKVRIVTLKVTRGTLSMKDSRVLEAITKANQLCNMMNAAKANANAK